MFWGVALLEAFRDAVRQLVAAPARKPRNSGPVATARGQVLFDTPGWNPFPVPALHGPDACVIRRRKRHHPLPSPRHGGNPGVSPKQIPLPCGQPRSCRAHHISQGHPTDPCRPAEGLEAGDQGQNGFRDPSFSSWVETGLE